MSRSPQCLFLLLQQYPTCLVHFAWMVCLIGSKCPSIYVNLVEALQLIFKTVGPELKPQQNKLLIYQLEEQCSFDIWCRLVNHNHSVAIFLINKYHSYRWVVVSWLNYLIPVVDLWASSNQHLVETHIWIFLPYFTSTMLNLMVYIAICFSEGAVWAIAHIILLYNIINSRSRK